MKARGPSRASAIARVLVLLAVTSLSVGASVAQGSQELPPETELDRQAREVASELRCPVCQGLSIQDSPSEMAQDMRALVREQLAQGKSPEEVKAFFVQGYGEWILMEPRAEGFNLAVYILPIVALIAGGALIVGLTRRWTRASSPASVPSVADDDPDLAPWDEAAAS